MSNYGILDRSSKVEKFHFFNSLKCLTIALEGMYTTIDLRNESCVCGKIVKVDGHMNIDMEDVTFYDPKGLQHVFPNFFIRHRNIRYVHIPENVSSMELIQKQLAKMRHQPRKQQHTFKKVRAERKQRETINSAYGVQSSSKT